MVFSFGSPILPHQISPVYINKHNGTVAILASRSTQSPNEPIRCDFPKPTVATRAPTLLDHQPLVDLLHQCAEKRSCISTKTVHGFVLRANYVEDDLVVLLNHIAYAYSKCLDFNAACGVFDNMSKRNAFSWTVMVLGSIENLLFHDGFEFFLEMQNQEILPDKFSYSAIVQLCIGLDSIELGETVHAQITKGGFASHTFVSTSLLNMYAKLGDMEASQKVFNSMTERNEVSWNAVISGFTTNDLYLEAYEYYLKMKQSGLTPNVYTFIGVLKAVGRLGDIEKGREVQNHVSELGMEPNVVIGTALIDMYGQCRSVSDARSVFDINFTNCQSNAPWNSMISAYSHCGCHKEALEMFTRMCQKNIRCDIFTYCSVFNAVAALKKLQIVKEVHGKVLKSGSYLVSTNVSNAVADAYAKCRSLEDVEKAFEITEDKDLVSWTTLVTGYCQCNEEEKALEAFLEMREKGFVPNQYTYSSVLAACATLSSLEFGQQVHGLLCKSKIETDKCIESSLIDMYSKCGNIIDAEKVFNVVQNPDVVSWTAIISGYAQHGLVTYALDVFKKMENEGIKPNAVTFLSVLFACSHGGLVDEGLHYFHLMEDTYGLVPEMEHYACMVDLLGRVGRLDDAMAFIKQMKSDPGEMVWQSLLGACRVHKNIEIGEIAAEKIVAVRPENPATYVLLSNTYIHSGRFEDGVSIREEIKERGMKKEPGCSWVSVKGRVHRFYAGDQQHPQRIEVYTVLEELRVKLKDMGYVPNLSCVLKDVRYIDGWKDTG